LTLETTVSTQANNETEAPNLSIGRNLKIGLFHLGSGMADVMATGIWNRIMISDLGFSATPIGLLVSLRYFLAPLGVWAGRMSDERTVFGFRRLFWVWFGRALMVISLLGLGVTTASLAQGVEASALVWIALTLSLLLFSLGNALSGSTFLALVYDRAPQHQRGRAVGLVWTFLLLGFSVGGILFGLLLPSNNAPAGALLFGMEQIVLRFGNPTILGFSAATLQNLFVIAALILGGLWFFSLLGEERRGSKIVREAQPDERGTSLRGDLKLAWGNRQTRVFFWYLALSMLFAFAQDLVLEPFAGDVFHMSARITTRFAAYWGSMAILGTLVFLALSRRYKRLTNTVMSVIGVAVLAVTFGVFALSSLVEIRSLVTPGLILLGIGLGAWNIGTLGMMMEMSPFGRAGTFLGFWTLVVTLARGLGVSGGGIVRDIVLQVTGNLNVSYGAVFALEMIGMVAALWLLSQVKGRASRSTQEVPAADTATILAGSMD